MKIQTKISTTAEADFLEDKSRNFNQQILNFKDEELETEESLLDVIFRDAYEFHKLKERLVLIRLTEVEKLRQHLISSKKVCELLRISERTLKTWRKEGIIPFIKIGKNAFYNPRELEAKLEQNYGRKSKL